MGAKNDLSEEERIRILTLHGEGYSRRKIQEVVPRSLGAIQRCITQQRLGIATKRPGRNPCVSDRDRRRVIREVSNKRISSAKVKARLELACSARTIRNIIKASGIIRWKKLSKKPLLSHAHRQRRMDFAAAHLTWRTRWKKIIFSDEKKFNLDGPDGNAFYYHDERKQEILRNRRQGGGKSVMIWAAIGWYGKSQIAFLDGNQNSAKYVQTLNQFLLPAAGQIGGPNWVLMQDNAPIHTSRVTRAWLAERGVRVLAWPARSPDLNPIENAWAAMSALVYEDGRQFDSVEALKDAISAAWVRISGEYRHNLFNSLPRRMQRVLDEQGKIISY